MDLSVVVPFLPRIANGLLVTLQLLGLSLAFGLMLALPLALMRVYGGWAARGFSWGFVFFFRGTPLLVQLFLIYYGLVQFESLRDGPLTAGLLSSAFWCSVLAFTLNTAAYTAEILRGAIQAVPHGEVEAAKALGMSAYQQFGRIILPRAARMALPAYSNEVVLMLQGTSVACIVTVSDLMGVVRSAGARTLAMVEFLVTAAVIYVVMTYVLTGLLRLLESRVNRHLGPRPG